MSPPADAVRIAIAFFMSGMAALIYQIAWQRLLFVVLGVDIESVTIIVSTFMMGLGLGALLGGWLADRLPERILLMFCAMEAGIAAFGLASVGLILAIGPAFPSLSHPAAALLSFLLLLFPTICMGATLPMLISHSVRGSGNVGKSTGGLYFINTLGAATGALAVGFFLLYWLDLAQVIRIAAGANLAASLTIASGMTRSVAR